MQKSFNNNFSSHPQLQKEAKQESAKPTSEGDKEERMDSLTWEIKSSEINIGEKLGQGAFGAVYKVRLSSFHHNLECSPMATIAAGQVAWPGSSGQGVAEAKARFEYFGRFPKRSRHHEQTATATSFALHVT